MNHIDEIIAEARRSLVCPICGRNYSEKEIKLRGYLDNAYIIQTVCDNGHAPLATVFIATTQEGQAPKFVNAVPTPLKDPLTLDDALTAHVEIEQFDGDFLKIWPTA